MSGKMGYLYPMMCDEVVPGDVFDISAEAVIRFAPMVAPVLHEIILKADWFFVPYRILSSRDPAYVDGASTWEKFITGGQSNTDATALPRVTTASVEGDLLDHLGCVPGVTLTGDDRMLAYPVYAYNLIYNEYYRDPNLEALATLNATTLLTANWDADYFTRALPWQQRGTAPALPIAGTTSAVYAGNKTIEYPAVSVTANVPMLTNNTNAQPYDAATKAGLEAGYLTKAKLDANTVDLSVASTFSISDFRVAVQLQRWLERNARTGYRYTEFLGSHFGVSPRDDRLDRPEYIGGLRQSIVVSEVLQTSESGTTPQGTMAGHGILAGKHSIGRYHAMEFGLIMCLMSIQPRSAYQQGIDRQWLRVSKYDFYFPEFANLSEQGIYNMEVYAQNTSGSLNKTVWGYQGRYDEMRSKRDRVAGAFRSSLAYWHAGRIFGSLPALNSSFGHVDPTATSCTRMFAAPSADTLYVHWGNRIKAIRPLPPTGSPGRMDHTYGGA